jgi:hypothetical protein
MSSAPHVPTPPTTAVPGRHEAGRLLRFWSVRLPRGLDPWVPELGDAFADDAWMAAWPKVAEFGPMVALAVGFVAPWVWPGMVNIYTESLLFLVLATAASLMNWSFGAALLLGYAAGDLLHEFTTINFRFGAPLQVIGGHIVAYLLLAILVVRIPQLAKDFANVAWLPTRATNRAVVRAALSAGASALLVFLWCQGMIVLIRPVFTWARRSPTDEAVKPLQVHWPWLVFFAIAAALARLVMESSQAATQSEDLRNVLEQERSTGDARRGVLWQSFPPIVRVVLVAAFLTVVLSGTYAGWIDAVIVFAATGATAAWHYRLFGKAPGSLLDLLARIPPILRIIAAVLAGYIVSSILLKIFWSFQSLRPVMLGALVTAVLLYALFPASETSESG